MDVSGRIAQSQALQRRVCQSQSGCVWAGIHPEYIGQYNEQKWQQVLASFDDAFSGDHAASSG